MGAVFDEEIEGPTETCLWQTGNLQCRWDTKNVLWKEWIMGYSTLLLSHLSTEYVLIPIAATQSGASYNPTNDEVQFAFMPNPTQIPGSGDWVSGGWETVPTSFLYPYNARCLVGPSGTINLTQGTYSVYVKITDSPEVPVLVAGQLIVS
jgi:hypothetical protein